MQRHRSVTLIACLACATLLASCGKGEQLTVWQTKKRFADAILRGAEVGVAWTMHADTFDETEGVLLAVRLDDGYGRYYFAERAYIVVDPSKDTVRFRLENVTGAAAEDEDKPGNPSGLYRAAQILTEPVSVPYDITP